MASTTGKALFHNYVNLTRIASWCLLSTCLFSGTLQQLSPAWKYISSCKYKSCFVLNRKHHVIWLDVTLLRNPVIPNIHLLEKCHITGTHWVGKNGELPSWPNAIMVLDKFSHKRLQETWRNFKIFKETSSLHVGVASGSYPYMAHTKYEVCFWGKSPSKQQGQEFGQGWPMQDMTLEKSSYMSCCLKRLSIGSKDDDCSVLSNS